MNKLSFCLTLALVASLVAGPPAHAELADTPWPMFHHDVRHTGRSEYAGPSNPEFAWSYETGSSVYSSPALGSDGRVYVGSYDNMLYAVASDGALSWSYVTGRWVESSPALGSDGRVYVGSCDTRLYAIAPNGALSWSYAAGGFVDSSPALGTDGQVYVGSDDARLYAIASDGALEWSYLTGDIVLSSPALGSDGRVYVGSYDNRLYCIRQAPTETPTITPTSTPTETPATTPTPPIDLTADKTEYGTTDSISVTADVWPLTVPCYPFVRILMADGSTLYYQSGVGFTASPVPYLGFEVGTIVTSEPIRDYLVLSASFSGIATGTYYLEGGAVDMTKTVSADNLIYFGTVDRETLTVK